MTRVYRHALLNISADVAKDARVGCLRDRDPLCFSPWRMDLTSIQKSFWVTVDERSAYPTVNGGPLGPRGWVFQERHLARRVLHFGAGEIFWECCSSSNPFASEAFPRGSPGSRILTADSISKFQTRKAWVLRENGTKDELYNVWNELCQMYSAKNFSFPYDKMSALSGLAKEFEQALNDVYIAGLWSSTLPHSLLWHADGSPTGPSTRPSQYRAPSWSWLAIDRRYAYYPSLHSTDKSLIELGGVDISYVTDDQTGPISYAKLTMRGIIRRVELKITKTPYKFPIPDRQHITITIDSGAPTKIQESSKTSFKILLDDDVHDIYDEQYDQCIQGYLMFLSTKGEPDNMVNTRYQGLLLEAADEPGNYKRLGTFEIRGVIAVQLLFQPRPGAGISSDDWRAFYTQCTKMVDEPEPSQQSEDPNVDQMAKLQISDNSTEQNVEDMKEHPVVKEPICPPGLERVEPQTVILI